MSLEDLGLQPESLISMMAFAAAFLGVLAVWYGLIAKNPMHARAKALARRRQGWRDGLLGPKRRQRPDQAMTAMRAVAARLNLLRGKLASEAEMGLMRAGWRSDDALAVYVVIKVGLPVVSAGAAFVLLSLAGIGSLDPMFQIFGIVAAATVGLFLPDWVIRFRAANRRKALQRALPDALDLLVICVEAGLGLDAALVRVSREMSNGAPEMAEELSLTAMELGFLPERRAALDNLLMRTDLPALRSVVNSLIQTEKYGTPLAQSLRVLSAEYRKERMLKAEEKAAKLPATLTVPMIVFILPTLFIVLLGPAVMRAMDALKGF